MSFISPDVRPGTRVLIVPLGSHEQHGPHLPLDTDTRIVDAVVAEALSRVDGRQFILAPTLPVTASDEHASFPGTLSVGTAATAAMIGGLLRSAWWSRGVCLVNGHGGNADALNEVMRASVGRGPSCTVWSPPILRNGDMHAGHVETSLMLHIDASSVRMSSAEPGAVGSDPGAIIAAMRSGGVASVAPNGVVGDPRGANAGDGREYLDAYVSSLADRLEHCLDQWPPHGG